MHFLFAILLHYEQLINNGDTSSTTIRDFITTEALIAQISPQMAVGVANAESRLNPTVKGDFGTSRGIFQIHLPAHPDISPTQAENIIFSTEWAASEMKKDGGCKIWSTCEQVMKSLTNDS